MSDPSAGCPNSHCNMKGAKFTVDRRYAYNPNCAGGKVMHIKQKSKGLNMGRTTIICHEMTDPVAKAKLPLILGTEGRSI